MKKVSFLFVACMLAVGCGGTDGGGACTNTIPCPEGFACDASGACVEAAPFIVATEELDAATVGVAYQFTVTASGGIPAYSSWAIETTQVWLTIDPDSGTLGGTPDKSSFGTEVTVSVRDSSFGDGASASKSFLLKVTDCEQEGQQTSCYRDEGGICKIGVQTCHEKTWTGCTDLDVSTSAQHCGPGCATCDPVKADRCNGVCACGTELPCTESDSCCTGACVNTLSSNVNCGSCGQDCNLLIQNAAGSHCDAGKCDFTSCLSGFLDCNADRSDGCETAIDSAHCGTCERDCTSNVQNADGVICDSGGGSGYHCEYSACSEPYGDCDGNRQNGCEIDLSDPLHCGACNSNCPAGGNNTACVYIDGVGFSCGCLAAGDCESDPAQQCCDNRCYEFADVAHCGNCITDCTNSPIGPICADPDNASCGCFYRTDCGGHDLCCNHVCTPVDDFHCGDCAIVCEAVYGGPLCDIDSESCYCTDNTECAGYGSESCVGSGTAARCAD